MFDMSKNYATKTCEQVSRPAEDRNIYWATEFMALQIVL